MCIVLFAWKVRKDFPLVMAANRDEFYERPTVQACPWPGSAGVIAGRDVQENGTWMGVAEDGRFGALTNFREPRALRADAPSRGALVRDYLLGGLPPLEYLQRIEPNAGDYNPFNVLLGDPCKLYWLSNMGEGIKEVPPGIHGLSNALLDTPWPKVVRGKAALAEAVSRPELCEQSLFSLLSDPTPAPDDQLPDTGVGPAWEKVLSAIFVQSPVYGTRSSTILLVDSGGAMIFEERHHVPLEPGGEAPEKPVRYELKMPSWKEG
ncbi:MAG: NRDE family protein [Deltaproteobacteria bacterium]|nr:NRDE family protein [Deltaproteobacteria bacterium]